MNPSRKIRSLKTRNASAAIAAISLGIFSVQAEPEKAAGDQEPPPEQGENAEPFLGALDLSDGRRSKLKEELETLHSGAEGPVWPEAFTREITANNAETIRQLLTKHGFKAEDLKWIEKLPEGSAADMRTSVLILHTRQLLNQGPARFEGHWSKWNEGDTPGSGPDAEKKEVSEIQQMAAEAGDDPGKVLESFVPKNRIYRRLQEHLTEVEANMQKLQKEFVSMPPVEEGKVVNVGDSYQGVDLLTRRLKEEGYMDGTPSSAPEGKDAEDKSAEGGVYTEEMAEAVKRFQERHARAVDGIIGPNTLAELNRSPEQELDILRINLHRARILPDKPGERFVIANVPSTTVHAFEENNEKPVLGMKTIVGESVRDNQTPMFRDIMEKLEFGPYWNVPNSIASEEIVPKARNNHSYLASNNYEIVSSYGSSETVSVSADALSKVESGALLIHQKPGPKNALGSVKFLFPNDYAIYLHDTPQDSLFAEAERDFSHGCIRVEKPADLAEWALSPQGWDRSKVEQALKSGENKTVALDNKVNVYIVYLTAYPSWDENDKRQVDFHPDLYKFDEKLLADSVSAEEEKKEQ